MTCLPTSSCPRSKSDLATASTALRWSISDLRLGQRLLGLVQIGLRRPQLGFIFRRRHPANDLPGFDFAAFLDGDVGEPAGIFRGDVDLGRLDAAVGLDDAVGHRSAEHAVEKKDFESRFRFAA